MRRVWQFYDRTTVGLLALTGAAMFGIAIVNALLRYLFGAPLVWSEEAARFCMIWGTLVGLSLAYRGGNHVAITLLVDMVPPGTLRALRILAHLLTLATAALLWQSGLALFTQLGTIQAPSSGIEMGWIYAAIPAGAALLAIEALRLLGTDLAALRRGAGP